MSSPSAISRIVLARNVAETLCFAAVGGVAFGMLGMPAGWLSGAIITVAAAALAGRPMFMPLRGLEVLQIAVGITLGAVVTPETLRGMATYPFSIAVLLAAMASVSYSASTYLRLAHGWDGITAYLAASPGAMSQVVAVGVELDADLRAIAIVQTLRVVVIAVGLPTALLALGLVGHDRAGVGGVVALSQLDELAVLIAASTVMALVAHWIRFPGGLLFGAMLTSGALHGGDYVHVTMPWWVANTALMGFGAVTGARFANTSVRLLFNFLGAALGSLAVGLAVTAVFAGVLLAFVKIPVAEVMIAYAPGSVDAMMVLALALHLDPVYVGAHHLLRIFFVSFTMPLVARSKARKLAAIDPALSDPTLRRQRQRFRWPFQD